MENLSYVPLQNIKIDRIVPTEYDVNNRLIINEKQLIDAFNLSIQKSYILSNKFMIF